jgi:hypothetical protein
MATIEDTLESIMTVDGAIAAALIDSKSGIVLCWHGNGFDMDTAGAGSTALIRAKLKTVKALKLNDMIEDILITMGRQYHIIRPVAREPDLFLYLVLDKARSNLAIARRFTANVETEMFN